MIASKALITPHSETTKVGIPHEWIIRPGYLYASPRKEWGGKARIRLTEISPYAVRPGSA